MVWGLGGPRLLRHPLVVRASRKFWKYDEKTGLFSAALPLGVIMVAGIMTTTLIMDRQWEFRDNRSKSLTNREFEQEEERKAMEAAFKRADDHFENVPVPGRRD